MSTESVSSLFPQRPIRPLPKRRLRERLSPEVADSIEYPPANRNSSPLFYYPNIVRDDPRSRTAGMNGLSRGAAAGSAPYAVISRGNPGHGESDEEELALSSSKVVRRSHPEILDRPPVAPLKPDQAKHPNPQPPPSTASSADGYESFENTNNKKKRKIPTAGDSSLSGPHSLADLTSIGASATTSPSNEHNDVGGVVPSSYCGAGGIVANNQGISGPGRGRFGRSRTGRSPLRALSDATNNWAGRAAKIRPPQWATSGETPGIISSAIANAEKIPSTPGQENVSLLHQHSSSIKSSPTATQFTFTCDSPVPKPQWPGTDPTGLLPSYSSGTRSTQASMATQTPGKATAGAMAGQNTHSQPGKAASPGTSKKKAWRRNERDLKNAAAQRRREAEEQRRKNPDQEEYICAFCEYERVYGEPPRALIRAYEIKDQQLRRKEAEKKRLLEKARTKGRKGKKPATKPPSKASSSQNQQQGGSATTQAAEGDDASSCNQYAPDSYADEEDDPRDLYPHEDPPMQVSSDDEAYEHDYHEEDDDVICDDMHCHTCHGHMEPCDDAHCHACHGHLTDEDDPGDSSH